MNEQLKILLKYILVNSVQHFVGDKDPAVPQTVKTLMPIYMHDYKTE